MVYLNRYERDNEMAWILSGSFANDPRGYLLLMFEARKETFKDRVNRNPADDRARGSLETLEWVIKEMEIDK